MGPHLCGPWWEVLKRPPDFVVLSGLLDFLADFHDGREVVVRKRETGTGGRLRREVW